MEVCAPEQIKAVDTNTKEEDKISPEPVIKHPLHNSWTLWFFKQDPGKAWEESQVMVSSFNTIEDFWSLFNHLEVVSKLKIGCDYSLFKEGIKPMWEDDVNKYGGRWLIGFNKSQRAYELDRFWIEIIMLLIGESFDGFSDEVNGTVANIRGKGDKLAIWTRDARNEMANVQIGKKVKEALQLPNGFHMNYQSHRDAASKKGSTVKSLYEV